MVGDYAAIVLAGGAARRLGGIDKVALVVRGEPILHRVLAAVRHARSRVVVGPPRDDLPDDVLVVREEPPGGGPVAATAAGFAAITVARAGFAVSAVRLERIVLLAADLPFLSAGTVATLVDALDAADSAVLVDADGRRQSLCGAWRRDVLAARLTAVGNPTGASMRTLFEGVRVAEIRPGGSGPAAGPPEWFDCDTEDDLRWAREHPG